jgi:hypothetical protein
VKDWFRFIFVKLLESSFENLKKQEGDGGCAGNGKEKGKRGYAFL